MTPGRRTETGLLGEITGSKASYAFPLEQTTWEPAPRGIQYRSSPGLALASIEQVCGFAVLRSGDHRPKIAQRNGVASD